MKIIQTPSPNQNERRYAVDMLVLHYTGMEDGPSALARMQDPEAQVSAHYMVDEAGDIYQLVDETQRAWHAGLSSWQGDGDLNSRSVGIEIVNGGHNIPLPDGSLPPFYLAQIGAVIELSNAIIARHHIPQSRVVGHSDIAPERKDDPGEHFPWEDLAARGVGLWPEMPTDSELREAEQVRLVLKPGANGGPVLRLQDSLRMIGYGLEPTAVYDELTMKVVTAFQRRWHQTEVTGLADIRTQLLIERVGQLSVGHA